MFENCKGKWTSDLGNGSYKNPILFADYSDPDAIRVGDDFFMTASSFTYFPGLPILHSKDLVNWKLVSYAAEKLPFKNYDLPQHGKGVWAPAIRYHNGTFFITFSAPDEGLFVVKTKDPFGKWDDVILQKEAKGWIDPCPFWDDDGQAYIVRGVARSRGGLKSQLFLHKMTPDGEKLLDEGVRIYDGRVHNPTIEGPKMYKRNGYYYIFSPAGGVKPGWQVVLRSKNIYGPYEHKIVLQQGETLINGPHQGALIDMENGESWFLHFRDCDGYGRMTYLEPARWTEDNWIEMGIDVDNDGIGEPVETYKKPVAGGEVLTPVTSDEFKDNKLGLQWQWQAHANKDFYEINNETLRLFSFPAAGEGLLTDAPNLLSQLMQAPNFTMDTKVSLNLEGGDEAGICITGGSFYAVRVENNGGKLSLSQANYFYDGKDRPEEITETKELSDTKEIYLRIKMEYRYKKLFFSLKDFYNPDKEYSGLGAFITFYYSEDGENFEKFGPEVEYKVSKKSWVGGRCGLFCVNREGKKGGYADFDYVRFG
ncbi:MAG: glycoside hydrolase 43 family protein [Clostridiales bacterium]|nr:glycoside hydrolase 43 family protein [Clostridiales bacterium]